MNEVIARLISVYGADHVSRASMDLGLTDAQLKQKYFFNANDVTALREFVASKKKPKLQAPVIIKKTRYEYVNPNPKPKQKQKPVVERKPGAGIQAMEDRLQELVNKFKK